MICSLSQTECIPHQLNLKPHTHFNLGQLILELQLLFWNFFNFYSMSGG